VPSVMGAGGRRLLDAREDRDCSFSHDLSAAEFHTLLRSGGEVHGAILGLTRCQLTSSRVMAKQEFLRASVSAQAASAFAVVGSCAGLFPDMRETAAP
jgi:hypothetical protein